MDVKALDFYAIKNDIVVIISIRGVKNVISAQIIVIKINTIITFTGNKINSLIKIRMA